MKIENTDIFLSKALSCPFCGSFSLFFTFMTEDREGIPVCVSCDECGCNGPWIYVKNEAECIFAVEKWNEREYNERD